MFNRYNTILLGAILCASLAVAYVAVTIQPLNGDLTRIGGYNEKDFGWRLPQRYFENDYLFEVADSLQDYDQAFDVVVLGDSFALRPGSSWVNYFTAATGLSVICFHHRDLSFKDIFQAPQYRKTPPKIFIYQSVERSAVKRLAEVADLHGGAAASAVSREPIQLQPVKHAMDLRSRHTHYENLTLRVAEAIHTIKTNVRKRFSTAVPRTVMLPLSGAAKGLFSSRNQTDILVYRDDILVRERWQRHWQDALAGYHRLVELFEKTGNTRLVTMVFPDKLAVYADYLANKQWRNSSVIPALSAVRSLPRLDLRYKEALERGIVDLYLPNNTHTSSMGSQIAAAEVLRYLEERWIVE